jgi:hypothetical protein
MASILGAMYSGTLEVPEPPEVLEVVAIAEPVAIAESVLLTEVAEATDEVALESIEMLKVPVSQV